MKILSIDIETYSSVDLGKSGVYAYTEAEDFEILLMAYAYDDEEVQIVDLASGEKVPADVVEAITNPKVIKTAFNAQFERTCLARYFNRGNATRTVEMQYGPHALTLGLPTSLAGVARCLNLEQQKMSEGKALIRYFSIPCKPTKANGEELEIFLIMIEKWETFKAYCKQDVEVERSIRKRLENYPMTDKELKLWF